MMKNFSNIVGLSILAVFLCGSVASAVPIRFGDNNNYWPDWNNGSSDDNQDVVGIPQLTGGTADINDAGYLTSLTIGQSTTSSSNWGLVSPGDLFIDTNSNQIWDYVVDLTSWTEAGQGNSDPAAGYYGIYTIVVKKKHVSLVPRTNRLWHRVGWNDRV